MSVVATGQRPVLLRNAHLGRWQMFGVLGAAAGATLGLFATTPLAGRVQFVLVTALLYAVGSTVLSVSVEGGRRARDRLLALAVWTALIVALLPIVSVLSYTIARGSRALSPGFLSHSMRGVGANEAAGGAYHSIIGTVEQVGLAMFISIPLGLLTAIYVTEYGTGRFAYLVRFFVDVMTGIPSIVAGLFIFAFWVLALHQGFSGVAAAFALSILMLPTIVRSSEEMIRLVPDSLREASYALGVPKWRTILSIVLPTASTGITTGVMLAVARVTGETAPLLLTAHGFDSINTSPVQGAQSGLPLFVFDQASQASRFAVDRAWAGALTLIVIVLVLYVLARLLTRRNQLVSDR